MNELIRVIYSELKKIHDRVYQCEADEKAEYPFITFNIQTGMKTDTRYDDTLVVEIWDTNEDTSDIENITDSIENHLDYKCINTNELSTVFYRETRSNSTQADDEVYCRELRFELQTYYFS